MESHLWNKALTIPYGVPLDTHDAMRSRHPLLILFSPSPDLPISGHMAIGPFLGKNHHLSTSMILNKMGFHCNLPQSLVFAPWWIGGIMGLCHLQSEMEMQQIVILICHL